MNAWTPVELAGWAAQIGAIAFLRFRGNREEDAAGVHGATLTYMACAFVLALGWAWRLGYQFVLASSGFWYFVADDPARWLLSWSWAVDPYLITWDGVWQGATFYLHGLAMRLGPDPLAASKFVSAFYPLIALIGVFLLTQGIYRDKALSAAAVVFLTPWWIHVVLGTGTMTELPVLGFLFAGSGLFFIGLRSVGRRRRVSLAAAAASYAVATAFHIVAWMALAGVLAVAFVYAISKGRGSGFGLRAWTVFSLAATAYCVLWFVACWIRFGEPLYFVQHYAELTRALADRIPLGRRLLIYPGSLVSTVFGFLPLALYGIVSGFARNSEERDRVRCVLAASVAFLIILMVASIRNPGGPPIRLTMTLAGVLVPISLAPLRPLLPEFGRLRQAAGTLRVRPAVAAGAGLAAAIAVSWFVGNHLRTMGLQRVVHGLEGDALGIGAWLRQEVVPARPLDGAASEGPVRLWLADSSFYSMLAMVYAGGHPGRIQEWKAGDPGVASMSPGQYLISDRPVDDVALVPHSRLGRYTVYRLRGPAGTGAAAGTMP